MNKLATTVSSLAHKTKFFCQKNSPEIFMGLGIVTLGASLIGVGRASLKANEVIKEHKANLENINECLENSEKYDYTHEDANIDIKKSYRNMALQMVCLYGPSIALAGVSVACFVHSNSILKSRNAALSSALAGVTREFKRYREKVIEKYGADVDREMRYAIKKEKVKDPDTNEKTEKAFGEKTSSENDYGPTTRIFDELNPNWQPVNAFNRSFLQAQERYANNILIARGVLYLNDVYDMLGFDKTPEGQVLGWLYRPNDNNHGGANFVDFGMFNFAKTSSKDFALGLTDSVVLDFNIDGYILDKVPERY